MKALHALLILVAISVYKADECSSAKPTKAKDCYHIPVLEDYHKCCFYKRNYFIQGQKTNVTYCHHTTKEEYDNLPNIVKSQKNFIKSNGGVLNDFEWDCSSNYLYISLLSLIVLFI